jgi:DNA repair and recombination protein RAD54 and RAD54-like protein
MKIFGWSEGKEILKLVGRLLLNSRQTLIDDFNNDSSKARVLLASTKACSEGISLVGASRVVLLDILWNPSIEVQAISRAHRIGQKKFVYVYQLITSGMKENEKFCVQANKKKISNLVFTPTLDEDNIKASVSTLEELDTTELIAEDKVLVEMTGHAKFKDVFQNI